MITDIFLLILISLLIIFASLTINFCLKFRLKFRGIINMAEHIENFLDQVDTPSPRDRKRDILKQNLAQLNTGKKQWTPEMIDKATEKQVENLLKKLQPTAQPKSCSKDLLSKMSGVDNFQQMMNDVNSNFLIQNSTSQLIGNMTEKLPSFAGNSPMEILGSHMYEKCGLYLAPVSLFCVIFNHLDWQKFHDLAEQRRVQRELMKKQEPDDFLGEINGLSGGESSQTIDKIEESREN